MSPTKWLRAKGRQIFSIKDSPHAIAVGVGMGIFFGFTPLWGLKTILAIGLTRLFRGNMVAAAVATTLHDIILPLMPLLLRWEYEIGYWVLSHPHVRPPHMRMHHQGAAIWFHWSTFFTVGRPLLLGSLIVATPFAIGTYWLTLAFILRSKRLSAAVEKATGSRAPMANDPPHRTSP